MKKRDTIIIPHWNTKYNNKNQKIEIILKFMIWLHAEDYLICCKIEKEWKTMEQKIFHFYKNIVAQFFKTLFLPYKIAQSIETGNYEKWFNIFVSSLSPLNEFIQTQLLHVTESTLSKTRHEMQGLFFLKSSTKISFL